MCPTQIVSLGMCDNLAAESVECNLKEAQVSVEWKNAEGCVRRGVRQKLNVQQWFYVLAFLHHGCVTRPNRSYELQRHDGK